METNGGKLGSAVVGAAVGAEETCHGAYGHYVALARLDHSGQKSFYCLE